MVEGWFRLHPRRIYRDNSKLENLISFRFDIIVKKGHSFVIGSLGGERLNKDGDVERYYIE